MSTINIPDSDFWLLMRAFLEEEGLVRQHLDSYNDFIENNLQRIIDEVGEIPIDAPINPFKVKLKRIEVGRPRIIEVDGSDHPIYPMEARLRSLTYSAPIYLEMAYTKNNKEGIVEFIHIGDIPVMMKSKLCLLYGNPPDVLVSLGEDPLDPGGYFVVNGSERVIVGLEDLAPNRILIDIDSTGTKPIYRAKVFSTTVGFRARIICEMKKNNEIQISIPGVPQSIPLIVMMRALGIESDKEIAEIVSLNRGVQDQLEASFEASIDVVDTNEDAIVYIGNRVAHGQVKEYRVRRAQTVLDRNFLPHIGNLPKNRREKAYFLGEMASRIIELKLGLREEDDKDHYANKRLKLAGPLLADLFRLAFRNLCRDIKYQLERMSIKKRRIRISASVRHGIITERVKHALATGNWGYGRVGITQLLDRTNHISTLSHLRRLQSPLSRSQPNFEARDLHPTHWGRLCPNETPEGSNCGLVKNLSLMASISINADSDEIKHFLLRLGVIPTRTPGQDLDTKGAKVFINGSFIGFSYSAEELVSSFREMRRKGIISFEANIACYKNDQEELLDEIYVSCDAGRVRRPVIVMENGQSLLTPEHIAKLKTKEIEWKNLIRGGIIEYLDAEEEENALIALATHTLMAEHTHLELAPYTMFGICAAIIPFAEHNQSPRNSYEAAMAKQALGIYSTNFFNRVDTQYHILHYPQLPLVKTKPMDVLGYFNRPPGQNYIVAVLSFGGYNMEDALIFNKASIQRGLGRSYFYRVYKAEGRRYLGGMKDKFEIPEAGMRGFRGEQYYRLLEEDGIISVESNVDGNGVLIGRSSPPRFLEEYRDFEVRGPTRRDTSVTMRPTENGVVDDVFYMSSAQGSELVKVRTRNQRIPELGDKFASRHGQKGVIGMVVPQEDLPFTEEGITPDVLINPHAMPSRMTIGQFLESIAGKAAALEGEIIDGTPFSNRKRSEIGSILEDHGFHYGGREVMYNGLTGERFEADIFMGVVYYQKLHHMVADKMHARARGQVQMLTRQPTEGRARGGGLRFGEMERDCLIGHGAALLLKDRLLEESDKTIIYICEKCGYLAYYDFKQRKYICKICDDDATISPIAISYAFKLLLQELMSLCVSPKLLLMERA